MLASVLFLRTHQYKIVLRRPFLSGTEKMFPVDLFLPIKYIKNGLYVGKQWWNKQKFFVSLPREIYYITNIINITGNLQQKILLLFFWLPS